VAFCAALPGPTEWPERPGRPATGWRALHSAGIACVVAAPGKIERPAQDRADEDDHRRRALCLQILVNAVQVWNARYMTASIDHLHATMRLCP
jgi:hypothetical protein